MEKHPLNIKLLAYIQCGRKEVYLLKMEKK